MKIQLDTKALERLIGGESEIEVELRNSVVQEFAKKHLKPLVNSSTLGKVMEEFKTIITAEIKAMLPVEWKRDGWNSNIKYNWKNTAEAKTLGLVFMARQRQSPNKPSEQYSQIM